MAGSPLLRPGCKRGHAVGRWFTVPLTGRRPGVNNEVRRERDIASGIREAGDK